MGYFKYIIKNAVDMQQIGGSYEYNAFARVLLKTMNETYSQLKSKVPFEITSRYLAAYFETYGKDCKYYFGKAVTDTTTICAEYSFDDINAVQKVLAATYYGG